MPLAETLNTPSTPVWFLAAVALCLPVCLVVFWRIGRWWITADPVPLPLDKAWPAVRWPAWFGLALFVALQVLMMAIASGYAEVAKTGLLPWEPLKVQDRMIGPGVLLSLIVPPLVGLFFVWRFGSGAAAAVGVRTGSLGSGLLHGIVAFAAILPVCLAAFIANMVLLTLLQTPYEPHPLLQAVLKSREAWKMLLMVFEAAVLAPLAEEFLYRGLLLATLLKQIGVVGALVISSAVFALVHATIEPQAVLPLFFLGMALAYVAYRTRSLVAPIVVHALFNALMVLGTITGQ